MNMNQQINLFFKYVTTIQSGTNKDIRNSKIQNIIFNPEFYASLIKGQYIKKNETTFWGYPFEIDYNEGADYWGMNLEPIKSSIEK